MKPFLFFLVITFLLSACGKDNNYEQQQKGMLTAHSWLLDSTYITRNGLFSIDKVKSPDYTRLEFGDTTFLFIQPITGVGNPNIAYRYEGYTSRIYHWLPQEKEDKNVYYNIQRLTENSLVYSSQSADSTGNITNFVYFYHAE